MYATFSSFSDVDHAKFKIYGVSKHLRFIICSLQIENQRILADYARK